MLKKLWILSGLTLILAATLVLSNHEPVLACGGFFCQNSPVDQNAERIIFTQNRDGTISAYVQIQYTGGAEDFSWILPLPHLITAEDIEVLKTPWPPSPNWRLRPIRFSFRRPCLAAPSRCYAACP